MKLLALTTIIFVLSVPILSRASARKQDTRGSDVCNLYTSNAIIGRSRKPVYPGQIDTSGKPVIFGKVFHAPELHMRFVRAERDEPIVPDEVDIRYFWEWFEYPYPEHDWGVWSEAEDWVKCTSGGDDQLVVPARDVKPAGWYDGKYTKFPYTLTGNKNPRFSHVVVDVVFGNCRPRFEIPARELDRYRDVIATLKLPCQWPVEVDFEKRTAPH
jgi:hypothetical protein